MMVSPMAGRPTRRLASRLTAATNGSYPDPTNSVKLTAPTSGSAHLFSPKVSVTPGTTYILKSFLNVQSITTG